VLVHLFRHTEFALNAVHEDAGFSTAIATKYTEYWRSIDFSYKDLPAFYPSLYQFILGKLSALLDVPPYRMMKYGMCASAFLMPLLSYALWKAVVGRHLAAFVTYVILGGELARDAHGGEWAGAVFLAYKPYEHMALTMFVPWWLRYVEGISLTGVERRRTPGFFISAAAIGGIILLTYYYWFFVGLLYLAVRFVVDLRWPESRGALRAQFRGRVAVLALTALVGAPFWVPLMMSTVVSGGEPLSNRWFQPEMIDLPRIGTAGLIDLVQLVGIVCAVACFRTILVARVIVLMLVSVLLWHLAGHVGIIVDAPLLPAKMNHMVLHWAAAGSALGLWLAGSLGQPWERRANVLGSLAICLVFLAYGQELIRIKDTALYERANLARVPSFLEDDEQTRPFHGTVFLTNIYDFNRFVPVFYFINENAHYAHPASHFRERIKFLSVISRSANPAFIAWMLAYNSFDRVDFAWLQGGSLVVFDDNFPHRETHRRVDIGFPPALFDTGYFIREPFAADLYRLEPPPRNAYETFSDRELLVAQHYAEAALEPEVTALVRARAAAETAPGRRLQQHLSQRRVPQYGAWADAFWAP
jgi:galactan 5-O-arabinofuranosyltransferase